MVTIRALRDAHGLTLPQMAARIAEHGVTVTPDSLSNVELGHKRASKPLMTAWARALGIKPLDVQQHEELCDRFDGAQTSPKAGAA